ncbi:MAG: UDP-2,3-diacylglucosamine diphosphatase LpxI [Candidatus Omnitrophica bacterium]|nr:UDP-2,3-diacylglucosamine diphosphatase LpxI [Candidatus Omnitrophota bacterium]
MEPKLLGLIAGNGKFPLLFSYKAKQNHYKVIAAAIKGDTSFFLRFSVDKLAWFRAGELKRLFSYFRENNVKKVIMAGQVNPNNLFDGKIALDDEFRSVFKAIENRKADTIFSAVADKFKEQDIELIDSTFLLKDMLSDKGTITKRAPTLSELADIEFGKNIAKTMGGIDSGQTVVVKDKAIVAVEAMEGTDRTILRGGLIAKSGAVVVKMSKPKQDLRFDVPVVGPRTIKTMIKAKASCLAIEEGKTIVIDKPQCLKLANKSGIVIVGA